MAEDYQIVHMTGRNNCGGRCIIHAHVRDGRVEKITTDTPQAAGDNVPLCAWTRECGRVPMNGLSRRVFGGFVRSHEEVKS